MIKPLSEKKIAIVDIETTGLSPKEHEIIEIAIKTPTEEWSTKIKPQNIANAQPKALEINGYASQPDAWDTAPTIEQVLPEIRKRLKGHVFVGHNVGFDWSFIEEAFRKHADRGLPFYHKIDTITLAYEHLAGCGLNSLSLKNVCTFLGISNEGEHTALADVRRTYAVYEKLNKATAFDRWVWKRQAAKKAKTKMKESTVDAISIILLGIMFLGGAFAYNHYYLQPRNDFLWSVNDCKNALVAERESYGMVTEDRRAWDECYNQLGGIAATTNKKGK